MTAFVSVTTIIFIFLTLFIDDIVAIPLPHKGHLVGKAYWAGLSIVPLILMSYVFYGMYINLMAGIYIEKKTKYLPYITGVAAVINVAANFILIPILNMTGAAIATLLSYIAMTAGIYYFSQKFYKINYEYAKLGFLVLIMLITYLVYFLIQTYDVLYIKILAFILLTASIFVFKIINPKIFKQFTK